MNIEVLFREKYFIAEIIWSTCTCVKRITDKLVVTLKTTVIYISYSPLLAK